MGKGGDNASENVGKKYSICKNLISKCGSKDIDTNKGITFNVNT